MEQHSKTVMIVEDDLDVREALGEILQQEGYSVVEASNGREALDALRRTSSLPCLILLDLMMPVMDGWTFRAEQIRDPALSAIPVVVVSAHLDPTPNVMSLRAASYLRKPVAIDALIDTIAHHC